MRLEAAAALGRAAVEEAPHRCVDVAVMAKRGGHQPVGERTVATIGDLRGGEWIEVAAGEDIGQPGGATLSQAQACPAVGLLQA